jgi:flagellar biosynthesis protein FlhG
VSRVVAVASGKGGTGKTSLAVNLALALGRMGKKACLLDADLGLSNVDVLLGINPELTLEHVLFENAPIERVIARTPYGLDVIPGASGVARLADLTRDARRRLAGEFARLEGYGYLLVDSSPGVSSQVISLCMACPELLVVVNPDPASITDAYALVKVLSENGLRRSPHLVVNKAPSAEAAVNVFERLRQAMGKYLKIDARLAGIIPDDPYVSAAAARRRPLLDAHPASPAARAVRELAASLDGFRLPGGVEAATPAEFLERAVVRLSESAPRAGGLALRGRAPSVEDGGRAPGAGLGANSRATSAGDLTGGLPEGLMAALDEALALAGLLDGADWRDAPGGPGASGASGAPGGPARPGQPPAHGGGVSRAPAGPGRTGSGKGPAARLVAAKLAAVLARARALAAGEDMEGQGGQRPPDKPLRVAVISSDASIAGILAESLDSTGHAVTPGDGRAEAAVVYWRGEPEDLRGRLADLGDVGYVFVRGVGSRQGPGMSPPAREVLDMPFRLADLAQAVRRCIPHERQWR